MSSPSRQDGVSRPDMWLMRWRLRAERAIAELVTAVLAASTVVPMLPVYCPGFSASKHLT
jgi:hypothetical protein